MERQRDRETEEQESLCLSLCLSLSPYLCASAPPWQCYCSNVVCFPGQACFGCNSGGLSTLARRLSNFCNARCSRPTTAIINRYGNNCARCRKISPTLPNIML